MVGIAVWYALRDALVLGMWNANSPEPMWWRTRPEITGLLSGFEVLEPGVVLLPYWRPHPHEQREERPERFGSYAALARTPATVAR